MLNNLVLGIHEDTGNPIFSKYTQEIIKKSDYAVYINYKKIYNQLGKKNLENTIKKYIVKNNVNNVFILFNGWDFLLDPNFLSEISKKSKIINFYFDTEYYFDNHDKYYAQIADLVVLPDINCASSYRDLLINSYTSFALYDENIYKKKKCEIKTIDVSFVGNLQIGKRAEYIKFLLLNGINVKTFGHDSKGGVISEEKMIDIFNRSKINLNFTGLQEFNKMPPGIPIIRKHMLQSKGRPIEISLCGGFTLSEFAPGISKMFIGSAELDTFHSKEELLTKIIHYLNIDDERENRALLAHKYALENYTLEKGIYNIFLTIEKSDRKIQEGLFDNIFLREYQYQHFKQALIFLSRFKVIYFIEELKIFILKNPLPIKRIILDIKRYINVHLK